MIAAHYPSTPDCIRCKHALGEWGQSIMNRTLAVVAAAMLVAGCGSITRGTSENVAINSTPIGAQVTTDIGMTCTAPCTLKVPRNKDFTITASAPGYKTATMKVGRKVSGGGAAGMAGNVVLGGIIGIAVDAGTGAAMDHTPNPAFVVLEAESAAPAAKAPIAKKAPKPSDEKPAEVPTT
jgi:hypothetical protein